MKVVFLRGAEQGEAEYDSSTDTYSWSYDGDDSHVKDLLSMLDSGKSFRGMFTDDPEPNPDKKKPELYNESKELLPWDEQIETLASRLRRQDFKIMYLGQ